MAATLIIHINQNEGKLTYRISQNEKETSDEVTFLMHLVSFAQMIYSQRKPGPGVFDSIILFKHRTLFRQILNAGIHSYAKSLEEINSTEGSISDPEIESQDKE